MADWIFQANPKHYDIVAALSQLDEIAWRVPQHTGDVQKGDGVFLWRSGKEAGIVGIGTVAAAPGLLPVPEIERPYVLEAGTEGGEETRVVLRVRQVSPVPKPVIASLPGMADHQICTAPMGTVFPLDDDQSRVLRSQVGSTFPAVLPDDAEGVPWPSVFSWKDRRKDVYPMPGGYDEQVESLLALIRIVAERRPTMDELAESIQARFGSSAGNARHIALFLRRTGFVNEVAGLLEPSPIGELLLKERDDALVLAHLHQRTRFVGEMLEALSEPRSATDLLAIANERYGMGWTTKAQIQRRRGWLQSVGAIRTDEAGRLVLTEAGRVTLARLQLHEPGAVEYEATADQTPPALSLADDSTQLWAPEQGEVDALVEELTASATDSSNPDRFEHAIAKAFTFLGFRAVQLGGAGKTDVVADADLGRDDSYRVIIDGKTTARDAVGDHQIDWDTIDEHRSQHEADYVVVAGPAFGGTRVANRAEDHSAILMTASDLAELVSQHAEIPLDLDVYRALFAAGAGEVDLESLTESVEASQRFVEIAIASLAQIEENVSEVGALSARDLHLLLRNLGDLESSEAEIQAALDALASPLVGALAQTAHGYRPSSQRANAVRRLRLLASALQG